MNTGDYTLQYIQQGAKISDMKVSFVLDSEDSSNSLGITFSIHVYVYACVCVCVCVCA